MGSCWMGRKKERATVSDFDIELIFYKHFIWATDNFVFVTFLISNFELTFLTALFFFRSFCRQFFI